MELEENNNIFTLDISEYLEKVVEERIQNLENRIGQLSNENSLLRSEHFSLKKELGSAKKELDRNSDFYNLLCSLNENIDLVSFFDAFGLLPDKEIGLNDLGEKPPPWFLVLCKYYSNKDLIFKIFDIIGIHYPETAKNIEMPYEYSKDKLIYFCSTIKNHYVCNSEIFRRNYDFWFSNLRRVSFDSIRLMGINYSQIPWQLILKNPLWTRDEDCFDAMLKVLGKDNGRYFYSLGEYQDIPDKKVEKMFDNIRYPVVGESGKKFLKKYFPKKKANINRCFKHISDNSYDPLFYAKFPPEYSFKFIKESETSIPTKIGMASKAGLTKQQMIEIISDG